MSELDRLKDLLLADERAERLAQSKILEDRLEAGFADLPQALPEILKRAQHDERLARALEKPLSQGLERIARTQKALLISVLFPLIGPVIRRSIAETLSQLVRDMNRAVEHSVSPTGLRWRWEAYKTGVPFAQVVLKHTLRYRVEHLLLVNNEGGLLVAHVANVNAELADSDAVAAMLSALQDFARDAVFARADEALSSVEVGGMTLKIMRGPLMHLAVAVRGELSEPAQSALAELVEQLHEGQDDAEQLESNKAEFRDLMADWMAKNAQESSEAADDARSSMRKKPLLLWSLLGISIAALCYWAALAIWHRHQATRLEAELSKVPGVLVTVRYEQGKFHVRGSRDPMADSISVIAARVEIPPQLIDQSKLTPHLSLEPVLWERRLRASGHLPDSLNLSSTEDTLKISGELTGAALESLRAKLSAWQTLLAFDLSGIRVSDAATVRRRLEIMRGLALMRIDFSATQQMQDEQTTRLLDRCQALLETAPDQRLFITLVEFSKKDAQLRSPSSAAQRIASRLRTELGRVTLQLLVASSAKNSEVLAPSEISLHPAKP